MQAAFDKKLEDARKVLTALGAKTRERIQKNL